MYTRNYQHILLFISLILMIYGQNLKSDGRIVQPLIMKPSKDLLFYQEEGGKKLQELISNSQRSDCWSRALQVREIIPFIQCFFLLK